jgi:hypothetical protein
MSFRSLYAKLRAPLAPDRKGSGKQREVNITVKCTSCGRTSSSVVTVMVGLDETDEARAAEAIATSAMRALRLECRTCGGARPELAAMLMPESN